MSKIMNRFCVDDIVKSNKAGKVLRIVDIYKNCNKYVYECSDGNLYNEDELYNYIAGEMQ